MNPLKPANREEHLIASDLGRKCGREVGEVLARNAALATGPYSRETIVLAGAASAIIWAAHAVRQGSVPTATHREVVEALVEMVLAADPVPTPQQQESR